MKDRISEILPRLKRHFGIWEIWQENTGEPWYKKVLAFLGIITPPAWYVAEFKYDHHAAYEEANEQISLAVTEFLNAFGQTLDEMVRVNEQISRAVTEFLNAFGQTLDEMVRVLDNVAAVINEGGKYDNND